MNRLPLSLLAVLALGVALASSTASAVPGVAATAAAGAGALVLDGEGSSQVRIVKVADVLVGTAGAGGFRLSITSGSIAKATGGVAAIAYLVTTVPDGAPPPSAGAFAAGTYVLESVGPGDVSLDLYIRYAAGALQDPGTYASAIGLTVEDR